MTMLKNKDINLMRDAAIKLEKTDLKMAHDLMAIAHNARPDGPFIKKKLFDYKAQLKIEADPEMQKLQQMVEAGELQQMVEAGDVAIIPVGFRCHTKRWIKEKLGVKQPSLPFDSGFFSPHSVASVISNPNIFMSLGGDDHNVCIKTEKNKDEQYGVGTAFETSTYDEINRVAESRNVENINKYLDSTFGYYTLNKEHKFVLAHFNWHPLADEKKSKGIVEPVKNLEIINGIFERRLSRMFELIDKARLVVFVFSNPPQNKYLKIDDEVFRLDDFDLLKKVMVEKAGTQSLFLDTANEPMLARDILSQLNAI